MRAEVIGRITVVQEDRIRVVDADGRGYLFIVQKRRAAHDDLARWRDQGTWLQIRYRGVPDAGAVATALQPVLPTFQSQERHYRWARGL
ncbi:MAG TPA: hypothetical protein VFS33_02060 [Gemmatimonadales bacterium]|nr:hypothetical protein [Gemmatimonadales bacterium]